MKHELQSAANFIAHLLRLNKKKISEPQLIRFRDSLIEVFVYVIETIGIQKNQKKDLVTGLFE